MALGLQDPGTLADAHGMEGLGGLGPGGDLHDGSLTQGRTGPVSTFSWREGKGSAGPGEKSLLIP